MSFAETLFEIARTDLDAAKCLFEQELYPQAVFYLQQSVEKANKSFAILNSIIEDDEKELKDVGHDSLKVFWRTLNKQKEKLERIKDAFEKIPELKDIKFLKGLDVEKNYEVAVDSLAAIKGLSKEKDRIVFIPKSEIVAIVEDLEKLDSQDLYLNQGKISEKGLNEIKESLFEVLDVFHHLNPQKIEEIKKDIDDFFTLNLMEEMIGVLQSAPIKDAIYVSRSLYHLSLIMLPHAIITRYPNNNHNPLTMYNKNLPLIQLFDELVVIMDKTLSKLGNLLTNSKDKES